MVKNQHSEQTLMSTFLPTQKPDRSANYISSLSSSTKSNKSALSTLSSLTNSSSERSSSGVAVTVDQVVVVGTLSTSASSSPSSFGSSDSSPNLSNSNSLLCRSTKLTISNNSADIIKRHVDESDVSVGSLLEAATKQAVSQLDSSPIAQFNSHREMPIDCPEYFVPEVKQKPCYPPQTTQTTVESTGEETKKNAKIKIKAKPTKEKAKPKPIVNKQHVEQSGLIHAELNNLKQENIVNIVDTEAVQPAVPKSVSLSDIPCDSSSFSSIRYIDEDSRSKVLPKSSPTRDDTSSFNFSFDNTLKNTFNEFSTTADSNGKCMHKTPLNLQLAAQGGTGKMSVGKALFEKQQLKEERVGGAVNNAFEMEHEDWVATTKTVVGVRPPTPPPRLDKQTLSFYVNKQEDLIDRACQGVEFYARCHTETVQVADKIQEPETSPRQVIDSTGKFIFDFLFRFFNVDRLINFKNNKISTRKLNFSCKINQ